MNDKIVEIIAEILDGIKNNLTPEEVNKTLSENKNIKKQDFSAAFSLLHDRIIANEKYKISNYENDFEFRILNSEELDILGTENYNYILHLKNIGLLNINDINFLIDQITYLPVETVSKKEINWLILFIIIDVKNNLLPGSRSLLFPSDTIN